MIKPNIAFLGLGTMGGGMTRRLLGAGFSLTVYNRNAEKCAPLVAEGAHAAATPREAARDADVIVSMVADDAASRGLWLGADGALAGIKNGAVLIEASTLSVGWVEELAGLARAHGCELLDAPVTGSKPQAAAGELVFLVGGAAEALEKARPVLAAMSKGIQHLGPTGSGALIKLINNFLCGVQAASLAEAVALIEKSGLDRDKALLILTKGTPGSPIVQTLAERMTAQTYTPNFLLRLMTKDLVYAGDEGKRRGVDLRTAAVAAEVYRSAIEAGDGERDLSAVVEQFRKTTIL